MAAMKIENIILSADIGTEIKVDKVHKKLEKAEYSPENFPGIILKLKSPSVIVLVFKSGKLVCTGARSEDEAKKELEAAIEALKGADVKIEKEPAFTVQNIISSLNLAGKVSLDDVAPVLEVDGQVEYEPDDFPALIFKDMEKAVAVMIFSNGKLISTGARTVDTAQKSLDNITEILTESGLLKE